MSIEKSEYRSRAVSFGVPVCIPASGPGDDPSLSNPVIGRATHGPHQVALNKEVVSCGAASARGSGWGPPVAPFSDFTLRFSG